MSGSRFQKAVQAWSESLGPEHVRTDPTDLSAFARAVSGLHRDIKAVVRPSTTEEVRRVVETANDHQAPLYPISCGKNWGMGSRLPVRDGATVVDLSRMNRIHEVNVEQHYAMIEPGVTQGQLYDYLVEHDLPLVLNVTGSGRDASLVGNALERGVGYFAARADEIFALEVVLGNGTIIRTGCGHFPQAVTTHINAHGVGPSLNGLFAQSNYGIVTRASVDLLPKREAHATMVCKIDDEGLLALMVDRLADLRRKGLIQTAVHIAHRERSRISVCPVLRDMLVREWKYSESEASNLAREWFEKEGFGAWCAVGGLMGTRAQLKEARQRVRAAMRGVGASIFITDGRIAIAQALSGVLGFIPSVRRKQVLLQAALPFYNLSKGIPTDAALGSVYWPVTEEMLERGADPNESRCGLLYCLPMIPMSGAAATEVMELVNRVLEPYELTPYVTFNMATTKALESVINIAFDLNDQNACRRAHQAMDELHDAVMKSGFVPYRVGINLMDRLTDPEDTYWQTVRDLKTVLDPNHIISPGRYNLV